MDVTFQTYLTEKAHVKAEHVSEIAGLASSKTFPKGKFLLSEGQVCRHFFFVEKGLLRLYSVDRDGKEHIVQFAPEGWFISDRGSVFFSEPSGFFIDAVEDSKVAMFEIGAISTASAISSEFRIYNEHILQNHIRHLQNRINLLIGASAEERYLAFIKLYPDLTLRVPQWMIASYLGITPESLSRVRKELARRNFRPHN